MGKEVSKFKGSVMDKIESFKEVLRKFNLTGVEHVKEFEKVYNYLTEKHNKEIDELKKVNKTRVEHIEELLLLCAKGKFGWEDREFKSYRKLSNHYKYDEPLGDIKLVSNKITDLESKLELLTECKRGSESGNIDCSKYDYIEKDYCVGCKNKKLIENMEKEG